MVATRKIDDVVKKWSEVTPARAPYYEAGIKNPLRDWATNAAAAESAWESGVQNAMTDKRFGKGVNKAGTAKWQRKSVAVGPGRFREGVAAAAPDYKEGFSPYLDEIEKITLPPRGAKGDPKNYDRVRAIGEALHKKKIGLI